MTPLFLDAFGITKHETVSLCGAGGKTTLLYTLADEAKNRGDRVLVTTTTRLFLPPPSCYDAIDLSGKIRFDPPPRQPGRYFCATGKASDPKVSSLSIAALTANRAAFDLILIEADGAAQKQLKGWTATEPVISDITTKTIGVIDIQMLGKPLSEQQVHRFDLFCRITTCNPGDILTTDHLRRMISHKNGLFQYARGQQLLFINKVETATQRELARKLAQHIPLPVVSGSLHRGIIHDPA